jgi:hypothetical protein
MQVSFSRLYGSHEVRATENNIPFQTDADAKKARDAFWKQARAEGKNAKRWVLKNQIREWWAFGVPCGQMCDVYMVDIWD